MTINLFEMMQQRLGIMAVDQSRQVKVLEVQQLEGEGFYPALLTIRFGDGVEVKTAVNDLFFNHEEKGRSFRHFNSPGTKVTTEVTPIRPREHAGSPCSCGNPHCAAGQPAGPPPTTVRGWAHQMIQQVNMRRADGTGGGNMLCYGGSATGPQQDRDHSPECDRLCAQLMGFGPWWVTFTARNREANKDQQASVAGDRPDFSKLVDRLVTGAPVRGADFRPQAAPDVAPDPVRDESLIRELAAVINRGSRENRSDTPDFILAAFMSDCLVTFERATVAREAWYNRAPDVATVGTTDVPQASVVAAPTPTVDQGRTDLAEAVRETVLYLCGQVKVAYQPETMKAASAALLDAVSALETIRRDTKR